MAELLRPESAGRFFGEIVGRRMLHVHEGDSASRAAILVSDPGAVFLNAFQALAPTITWYSGSARTLRRKRSG